MKNFKKIALSTLTLATLLVGGLMLSGSAKAAPSCFQYQNSGNFTTSTTPVFNNICGDPTGINSTSGSVPIGDESNFVRVRQDTSGDVTSNKNNPPLVYGTLNSSCNNGSKYDVWTYIHNDAMSAYNNNGAGSAVAHNTQLAINAPGIGATNSQFPFTSTISADNAATVSDTAIINCNGQTVKLTLVPGTVYYTTDVANPTFQNLPDSAVNGTTKIGNPVFGSGDQWGCWDYRIVVVYQVQVQILPPAPSTGVCKQATINVDEDNRTVTVSNVQASVSNAQAIGYRIDFGDGTVVNSQSASHTYAQAGNYKITTYVEIQFANGSTQWVTSNNCAAPAVFTSTPPVTPPPTPTPTSLPSTGPAGIVSVFLGASLLAGLAHWFYRRRKFAQQ